MMITCIIIDDEAFNRELIQDFITKLNPSFNIIGEASNIADGFNMIRKLKPDLIFLDIKMPGGSGFDLLEKFKLNEFEVVFITGFDEYAIKAFEFNAMDYVLKPIDQSKFRQTLNTIKHRFDNKLSNVNNLKNIIKIFNKEDAIITKIPIHHKHEVILLDVQDLMYIEVEEGKTLFFAMDNQTYSSARRLNEFDFVLSPNTNFIQVNKSAYINLKFIKSYSKGEICTIKMQNSKSFEVSRRKKSEILAIIDRK